MIAHKNRPPAPPGRASRGARGRSGRRAAAVLVGALAAAGLWWGSLPTQAHPAARSGRVACGQPRATASYSRAVADALRARRDIWGDALLRSPGGPTYERARRFLGPLLLARGLGRLTTSGVHYVPLSMPSTVDGAGPVALHVADGSQIVSGYVHRRTLTVFVGRERYGSCFGRLTPGRLADGWLPILQTRYADAAGNAYEQESFVARLPSRQAVASFVGLTVHARRPVLVRLQVAGGETRRFRTSAGESRTFHVAWQGGRALGAVSPGMYEKARKATAAYWVRRANGGASVEVPEKVVMDAWRAVLVQNLGLAWRYSRGNPYEEFSFPEAMDVAQVMAEWGDRAVSRSILDGALAREPTRYPNWEMGEKLVAAATWYRLFRDRRYLARITPTLRRYVAELERQVAASPRGLLTRERYSSDVSASVYGLHSQAVAWQGMRAIAAAWADAGDSAQAGSVRASATRLEQALRRAVASSQERLRDGSLFVPMMLLDRERPYASVTEARLGSYWNLVMPYVLASGLFRPRGEHAEGIFRYMHLHGSRLLGLVRAGAYTLYGRGQFPRGGTDEVYGINVARFLAENDEPDELVLSLYGQLAAAMTPGTFVGGEAASVAPYRGGYLRTAFLPPNSASNAAFLTKLRLMLVAETRGADGEPSGLRLGFATPRAWLDPGKRVVVRQMPTSAGPVSFALHADAGSVRATVHVPRRRLLSRLALRLRLPHGVRISSLSVDGRRSSRFDASTGTIDLTGRHGTVRLVAKTAARSPAVAPSAAQGVRRVAIHYRARNGELRAATVVMPAWYGRAKNPPIPLVISPHGRGLDGRSNARLWGDLPGRGSFAVISPDGQGRRVPQYSWGFRGQIDDLARMPQILRRSLPWLRIDAHRIYAFGGSMGGQESLLLLARHPGLLAGVAAFDSVTDFARQYRRLRRLTCRGACARAWVVPLGIGLREYAIEEVGGPPETAPAAWAARSPLTYSRRIARSGVPLQLWWSVSDGVVSDQRRQSGLLFRRIRRLRPHAPVYAFVGSWRHSAEMKATSRLPLALHTFHLLPGAVRKPRGLQTLTLRGRRDAGGRGCASRSAAPAPWCAPRRAARPWSRRAG